MAEFSDNIYDKSLEDGYGYAYYHLRIFGLMNNKHLNKYGNNLAFHLGVFIDKNAKEFLKNQKGWDLAYAEAMHKRLNKSPEEIVSKAIHNPPITINISDIDFEDNDYLRSSIKSKKDIILLCTDLHMDRVISPKSGQIIADYPQRIHQLMAYHLSGCSEYEESETADWFWDLYDIIYFNFDYDFTTRKQYQHLLSTTGDLSDLWLTKRKIIKRYLALLNKFIATISYGQYPFNDFCYQFFGNLLRDLIENKKICQCGLCGDVFPFKTKKKYCALLSEGKDCGKKARNRQFYLKHRDIILPKARKSTKELRAFYKEKGIKK